MDPYSLQQLESTSQINPAFQQCVMVPAYFPMLPQTLMGGQLSDFVTGIRPELPSNPAEDTSAFGNMTDPAFSVMSGHPSQTGMYIPFTDPPVSNSACLRNLMMPMPSCHHQYPQSIPMPTNLPIVGKNHTVNPYNHAPNCRRVMQPHDHTPNFRKTGNAKIQKNQRPEPRRHQRDSSSNIKGPHKIHTAPQNLRCFESDSIRIYHRPAPTPNQLITCEEQDALKKFMSAKRNNPDKEISERIPPEERARRELQRAKNRQSAAKTRHRFKNQMEALHLKVVQLQTEIRRKEQVERSVTSEYIRLQSKLTNCERIIAQTNRMSNSPMLKLNTVPPPPMDNEESFDD